MFNKIKTYSPKRNKFDLSHERKLSANMGDLVPIMCQEVLPGDSFRVNSELLVRFAPMLAPMMHRVNVFTHFFFVPNRLVWSEWESFITGGADGTAAPVAPYFLGPCQPLAVPRFGLGSLPDYFGLPVTSLTPSANQKKISALPFRAYQTIYNEYYRDQNLSTAVPITKNSGEIDIIADAAELDATLSMRKRSWEHDYFTSALPWSQRGGAVAVPGDGAYYTKQGGTNDGDPAAAGAVTMGAGGILQDSAPDNLRHEVSTLINDLRKANSLQRFLEKMALGGSRYVEQMKTMFGVSSSDARLQRPEYLGGSRSPVVVSEVLSNFQFSGDAEGLPQGNMAGHGIAAGSNHGFKRSFEEHGYVIGILSVLPKTAYQQGLPKHFQRFDRFDYAWPDFAHLGEQEVLTRELYWDMGLPQQGNDSTFGYQARYADYKYQPSTVHGDFRENLAFWHMSRIFTAEPSLNAGFVESDPTTRIFAVEDPALHHLYCQVYNDVSALRPLPYFGTPSL
ncbi:MAG: major capsid protein [Microvirus sp.]|nr:MAG: major capsid protein [Microvirus sp.]